MSGDPVNHPDHYTSGKIECIAAIREALGLRGFVDYCRAAIIKYAWRSDKKENEIQDLRKIAWYATRAADELEDALRNTGRAPKRK